MVNNRLKLKNFGPVRNLELPVGWSVERLEEEESGPEVGELARYVPFAKAEVQLCLFIKAEPLSLRSRTAFQDILKSPNKILSDSQKRSLSEILGTLALKEEFSISTCEIRALSKRKVLFLEGDWLNSGLHSWHWFVDSDRDGRILSQIYYATAASEFNKYSSVVSEALNSIEWKD